MPVGGRVAVGHAVMRFGKVACGMCLPYGGAVLGHGRESCLSLDSECDSPVPSTGD